MKSTRMVRFQKWFLRYGLGKQKSFFESLRFSEKLEDRRLWYALVDVVGRVYRKGLKDGKLNRN